MITTTRAYAGMYISYLSKFDSNYTNYLCEIKYDCGTNEGINNISVTRP